MNLVADAVRFEYPGLPPILDGASIEVSTGDVMCLLGPNGTGKTTLLRCMLGLARPSAGAVRVDGRDLYAMSGRERALLIASVPQTSIPTFPYQVLDVVVMGRTPHVGLVATPSAADYRIASDALDRVGIGHLAQRPITQVSGGERQLALIARALAQEARFLVMDEPTASLDYGNQVRILHIVADLARQGFGVLITTHAPEHALLSATRVALISGGRTVAVGAPDDVISSESLSALYGVPIEVTSTVLADAREARICIPLMASQVRAAHTTRAYGRHVAEEREP